MARERLEAERLVSSQSIHVKYVKQYQPLPISKLKFKFIVQKAEAKEAQENARKAEEAAAQAKQKRLLELREEKVFVEN